MILKALYDYYYRLRAVDNTIAPMGFKEQEIPFLIVIDKDGNFIRLEDRRSGKNNSQKFLVVAGSRTSGVKPYLFYDNLEYVLGQPKDDKKNTLAKARLKNEAFIKKCKELHEKYPECVDFSAVVSFYQKGGMEHVMNDAHWTELIRKPGANVSFLLRDKTEIVASVKELQTEANAYEDDVTSDSCTVCLITGERSQPVDTTQATMIPGSQATAKLVAFQINSGYDSYGKSKGRNAPISKEAEAAYTTALLRLTNKQSRNKFYIGNRTFLFWTSSNSEGSKAAEESMFSLFGISETNQDDPNRGIENVRSTLMSIYNGDLPSTDDDKFYILGLAPNSARIAVVYWNETTVRDFARIILKHFDDMEIVDNRKEKRPYFGLRQMMAAVTLGGKASDVQPNLPEATMKSILQGIPYPYTLFASAIRRIRAEQSDRMQIARVAIIKAFLNRTNNYKTITPMLDKENNNLGYICGRLFAVLEYSQNRANNITTIKSRYMNSASATPAAVFATLLNLNVHHLEKIDNVGAKIFIENMKQEIIDLLPADGFPSHLDLNDQGRFFVGYYHQIHAIYTKKDNKQE